VDAIGFQEALTQLPPGIKGGFRVLPENQALICHKKSNQNKRKLKLISEKDQHFSKKDGTFVFVCDT
jgi:hypothetical protein